MTQATITQLTEAFSQEAYDRFVNKQVRIMQRRRDKGNNKFASFTDSEILELATALAIFYEAGKVWK